MSYTPSPDLVRAAMLVSLNIRQYAGRKEDKKVSKKVARDNAASDDAGAYMKNLVPKEALEPITKAISALRSFHYENTLPWLDDGVRILPSQNYTDYRAKFETLRDGYDVAVRDFCNAWPQIIADAQRTRGALFDPAEYPADIKSKFGVRLEFMPLADTGDIRVNITEAEKELLRASYAAKLDAAQTAAMADLYRRLGVAVKAMADRLRAYVPASGEDKAQGVFRDSLVENLRELVALIPRMVLTQDAELEKIRQIVERDLCAVDAGTLRENDSARAKVAESAEAIAARLGEFMGGEAAS